jgi:hypothetical protein
LVDLTGNELDAILESPNYLNYKKGLFLNEKTILKMPLFTSDIDVLPDVFTMSFVISLIDLGEKTNLYWLKMTHGELEIGIGIETESGHLLIKNINKEWIPFTLLAPLDGPCGMVKDVFYQISIVYDMRMLKFSIICNGSPLLYVKLPQYVSQTEISEITDLEIGGNDGNFAMQFFSVYSGAFAIAKEEYNLAGIQIHYNELLGKFIQAPSFSVKVGGILELGPKITAETEILDRLSSINLKNIPDETSSLEIIIDETSYIRKVVPIITSTGAWIFPRIESNGLVTRMTFKYICLESGPVNVTAVFPDIWTTLDWDYECMNTITPKNRIKTIDGI